MVGSAIEFRYPSAHHVNSFAMEWWQPVSNILLRNRFKVVTSNADGGALLSAPNEIKNTC